MKPPFYYGWVIVVTLFFVNFAVHATGTLNLGLFVIPMGEAMGISRSTFGWLTTARYLASGFTSLFLGRLLDRFGPRLIIPVAALVTGMGVIGFGLADNVLQLFILFTIVGLAGLSTPGGGILSTVPVAKWFVRRRGVALGLASLGLGVGGIVLLPVTQLFIEVVDWRDAWLYLGIVSMVLIIPMSLLFLRRQPEDMGLRPDGDPVVIEQQSPGEQNAEEEAVWTIGEALRTRAFWMLVMAMMLGGFGMGASVHRIPYSVEKGFDADLVAVAISADAGGAAAMLLLVGFLLDRFPARFVAAGAYLGFTMAVGLMLVASSATEMFTSTILWGLSVGINIVSQTYMWANYFGRAFLGTIRGLTMPTIMLASAFGAPVVGYIYDNSDGYELAWQSLMAIYLLALVVMLSATPPSKALDAAVSAVASD